MPLYIPSSGASGIAAITGGTIAGITGFGLRDTSAAFDVTLGFTSSVALTAARTLTLDVLNASRSIKLAGNVDLGGNFTTTGSGTIALGGYTLTVPATGTAALLGANVFTTLQTITQANANTGILASTGYSLTGSNATSMIDLAGTWNTSGSPTLIKANVTNTASGASSKLIDLQKNSTSCFSVSDDGTSSYIRGRDNSGILAYVYSVQIQVGGYSYLNVRNIGSTELVNGGYLAFAPTFIADTWLKRKTAASLGLGETHATTPTAQYLSAHNVTTGTGASLTLSGGTGSVAGGACHLAASVTTGAPVPRVTADAVGLGFYNVTPVARQVVPTGSSTDTLITALQTLGLISQS
jgi:hypothetical protein